MAKGRVFLSDGLGYSPPPSRWSPDGLFIGFGLPIVGGIVSNVQQYDAAVARCEAGATDNGHAVSSWYRVDERLHASLCGVCGEMVWVSRHNHEEGWRVGGRALRQDCPEKGVEGGLVPS